MDWTTLFFATWAGAATMIAFRYRQLAKHALDLAQDSIDGWKGTVEQFEQATEMVKAVQKSLNNQVIEARPVERKDKLN